MIKFTKMQGLGNSYIYVNGFNENVSNPNELSKVCADVHFGIGAEGLVLILPSDIADFKMRLFNADGSEAEIGGNALRCVGKYVYEKGLTSKTEMTLETLGGIKKITLNISDGIVKEVTVDMGKFVIVPSKIPINMDGDSVIHRPIKVDGSEYRITGVSIGNPHAVVYVRNVNDVDVEELGSKFEHHELFPQRINTEFVQVIDRDLLKMRVWERGNGETMACGTGACASVVASVLNGLCDYDTEITVKVLGGALKIICKRDGTVIKTGPAEFIFDGCLADSVIPQ